VLQSQFLVLAVVLCLYLSGSHAVCGETPANISAKAQTAPLDCSEANVDFLDTPGLTRQEKSELMDKALFTSLSHFDACQNQKNRSQNASGGTSGGSNGGGGSQGGGEAGEDSSQGQAGSKSVADTDMSGTDANTEQSDKEAAASSLSSVQSMGVSGSQTDIKAEEMDVEHSGGEQQSNQGGNGKIPEDIPPSDNDSVLEAQIRNAAMKEKDPIVRKRLWDEYRKYKGLPKAQ